METVMYIAQFAATATQTVTASFNGPWSIAADGLAGGEKIVVHVRTNGNNYVPLVFGGVTAELTASVKFYASPFPMDVKIVKDTTASAVIHCSYYD